MFTTQEICINCYLSSERYHVVFTERKDVDVLDNDQLIVVLVEDRAVHQIPNVLLVALGEVKHGLGISLGGLAKSLSFRIFANTLKDSSDSSGQLCKSLFGFLRSRLLPLPGSRA